MNNDYLELKSKYKMLKESLSLLIIFIVVIIILILISFFSNSEVTIDIYDGNIYLHETKYWGIAETYKEIRYTKDKWEIKNNDSWEEIFFLDNYYKY